MVKNELAFWDGDDSGWEWNIDAVITALQSLQYLEGMVVEEQSSRGNVIESQDLEGMVIEEQDLGGVVGA